VLFCLHNCFRFVGCKDIKVWGCGKEFLPSLSEKQIKICTFAENTKQ
jgi:hypothetical protein